MKKLFPILVLLGACAPDIQQDPAPSTDVVIVNFDPAHTDPATGEPDAIVPLPNDLARADATTGVIVPGAKIHVPPPPSSRPYTDAQKEFDKNYLETLDGFPYESTASVTISGDLKPETVNAKTILVFDVTNKALPVPVMIAPTFANKTITIPPPAGNWTRAHTLRDRRHRRRERPPRRGAVKTSSARQTWALVSSRNPLVTCPDLNRRTVSPPSTSSRRRRPIPTRSSPTRRRRRCSSSSSASATRRSSTRSRRRRSTWTARTSRSSGRSPSSTPAR